MLNDHLPRQDIFWAKECLNKFKMTQVIQRILSDYEHVHYLDCDGVMSIHMSKPNMLYTLNLLSQFPSIKNKLIPKVFELIIGKTGTR